MTNKEKETIETMQTLTSLKYGSSVVCERKDIEVLLNLIEKQQKEIEEKDKRIFYLENELRKEVNQELDKAKVDLYKNYVPKEAIRGISNYIEYYLLGNLRYKDSQRVFEILLKKLKEILGE